MPFSIQKLHPTFFLLTCKGCWVIASVQVGHGIYCIQEIYLYIEKCCRVGGVGWENEESGAKRLPCSVKLPTLLVHYTLHFIYFLFYPVKNILDFFH